jgi:hypothetical protein
MMPTHEMENALRVELVRWLNDHRLKGGGLGVRLKVAVAAEAALSAPGSSRLKARRAR